jgi:hypothetical protein
MSSIADFPVDSGVVIPLPPGVGIPTPAVASHRVIAHVTGHAGRMLKIVPTGASADHIRAHGAEPVKSLISPDRVEARPLA